MLRSRSKLSLTRSLGGSGRYAALKGEEHVMEITHDLLIWVIRAVIVVRPRRADIRVWIRTSHEEAMWEIMYVFFYVALVGVGIILMSMVVAGGLWLWLARVGFARGDLSNVLELDNLGPDWQHLQSQLCRRDISGTQALLVPLCTTHFCNSSSKPLLSEWRRGDALVQCWTTCWACYALLGSAGKRCRPQVQGRRLSRPLVVPGTPI